MNDENTENNKELEDKELKDKELKATCIQCGFSAHPEKFYACLSVHHDLRCPECGTTNIHWSYGKYKDNTLVLD